CGDDEFAAHETADRRVGVVAFKHSDVDSLSYVTVAERAGLRLDYEHELAVVVLANRRVRNDRVVILPLFTDSQIQALTDYDVSGQRYRRYLRVARILRII